jgi:hypothetical protein
MTHFHHCLALLSLLGPALPLGAQCKRQPELYQQYMEAGIRASDQVDRILAMNRAQSGQSMVAPYLRTMWDNYSKAANLGSPGGLYRIGDMYERGWFVERDLQKAAEYYERAAACDQPGAEYRLGAFHETGTQYPESYAEAARWYRKAADHNYPDGYFTLGMYAMEGLNGPRNVKEAVSLMSQACTIAKRSPGRAPDAQDFCWSSYALSKYPDISSGKQLFETVDRLEDEKVSADTPRPPKGCTTVLAPHTNLNGHMTPFFGYRRCN